ncbi:unnamed protein product [Didymodactylos carnosus]|uniref:Uncharacterized protein n=1 Tax=Didymodactylos carnosus TaxID=1234261 RepID=A0A815QDM7_9BILA|nr:unnamed protein product [Didymodactylos carnosus]CAF4331984.1 unnamed protein product [Didymodactylos carnosus]
MKGDPDSMSLDDVLKKAEKAELQLLYRRKEETQKVNSQELSRSITCQPISMKTPETTVVVANLDIVSLDYWHLLKGADPITSYSGADIVGPEGGSIEPVGWVEASIIIAGQNSHHPVILARKFNQKVLLGTDFMFETGLVLDIQDRKFWLRDKPLAKFLLSIDLHQSGRLDISVYALEKKRLPPFHQTFVSVRTPSEISDQKWEASTTGVNTRLSTANSIVTVDKNITTAKVANLTSR